MHGGVIVSRGRVNTKLIHKYHAGVLKAQGKVNLEGGGCRLVRVGQDQRMGEDVGAWHGWCWCRERLHSTIIIPSAMSLLYTEALLSASFLVFLHGQDASNKSSLRRGIIGPRLRLCGMSVKARRIRSTCLRLAGVSRAYAQRGGPYRSFPRAAALRIRRRVRARGPRTLGMSPASEFTTLSDCWAAASI